MTVHLVGITLKAPSGMSEVLPIVPLAVRFKHPDPAVVIADLKDVCRAVVAAEPWLSRDITVHVVSGGITNLLYRLECEDKVIFLCMSTHEHYYIDSVGAGCARPRIW